MLAPPQQPQKSPGDQLATAVILNRLEELNRKVNQTDPVLIQVLGQLAAAVQQMNAPKKVLRDELQRVIGVAPVEGPKPPKVQLPKTLLPTA